MKTILVVLLLSGIASGQTHGCIELTMNRRKPMPCATKNEAKPTDGIEPTYTVEPVTQKVPHCAKGFKLMRFMDALTNIGGLYVSPEIVPQPPKWIDDSIPNADVEFSGYRCFPDPKVKTKTTTAIYEIYSGTVEPAIATLDASGKTLILRSGVAISPDIRYCDDLPAKDAEQECVMRKEEWAIEQKKIATLTSLAKKSIALCERGIRRLNAVNVVGKYPLTTSKKWAILILLWRDANRPILSPAIKSTRFRTSIRSSRMTMPVWNILKSNAGPAALHFATAPSAATWSASIIA